MLITQLLAGEGNTPPSSDAIRLHMADVYAKIFAEVSRMQPRDRHARQTAAKARAVYAELACSLTQSASASQP